MSHLYPRYEVLQKTFPSQSRDGASPQPSKATPYQARMDLYSAYSTIEDKAKKLSAEATAEFNKATSHPKTAQIELYSGKYYAACTFGGILACVSPFTELSIFFYSFTKHVPDRIY